MPPCGHRHYSEVYHDFPYLNKDVRGVMSSMLFENEG